MVLKTFEDSDAAAELVVDKHKEQLDLLELQSELQMRSSEVESA